MDGYTVLNKPEPTDGFRASVARAIKSHARDTYASNEDAPGAVRHVNACDRLANHIDGLPLWDSRFRQLLQVSRDSDTFTLNTGEAARFVQLLGLDFPAPPDVDAVATEFVIACGSRPAPSPEEATLVSSLRSQIDDNRRVDHAKIGDLQAELERRDREIDDVKTMNSDLRGKLESLDDGNRLETVSRRLTQAEGERDQADARAAELASELRDAHTHIEKLEAKPKAKPKQRAKAVA